MEASASDIEDRLVRLLGLGEGELGRAARLVSLIFVLSASLVMLKSAQNGIFLLAYPQTMIPRAFFASAALLSTTSMLLVPLAARLGAARLAMVSMAACAAAVLVLRLLLALHVPYAPFILYAVVETVAGVLLIQGWAVVSQATTPRSAKRLLPVAGAGATVAWTVFGLLVPPVTHRMGAPFLLLVAPVLFGVSIFLVAAIRTRDLPLASGKPRRRSMVAEWRSAFAFLRSVPLMRVMTALSILALLTEQLMDFLLMSSAYDRFRTADSCAAFFGRYYGITSAVTLVFVLFFSSRLLFGLGTSRALLVTPLLTIVGAVAAFVVPGFLSAVMLRGLDRVLKQSVWSSASEQTQTPLPPIERVQSRALVRGVLAPAAYAASAVVMSLLPRAPTSRELAAGTFLGVVAMAGLCLSGVRRAYRLALRRAIDERTFDLDAQPSSRMDADTRKTLLAELASGDARRAGLAAELLCDGDEAPGEDVLRMALSSTFDHVRIAALEAVARHRAMGMAEACEERLRADPEPACRVRAARALGALPALPASAEALLGTVADDATHPAQAAAAVALVVARAHRTPGAIGYASLIESPDERIVTEALETLIRDGAPDAERDDVIRSLRRALVSGRGDAVKLAAVAAAGKLRATKLLPPIVALLSEHIGPDVAERLVEWGDEALTYVREAVVDASAESVRHVASALTGLPGGPLLERLLSHEDPEVRDRAARSLAYAVAQGTVPLPVETQIGPLLDRELATAYRMYAILSGLAKDDGIPDWKIDPPFDRLGAEIEREVAQSRERVLHLLALTGHKRLVSAVEAGMRRATADVDGKIAELVDATLGRELARRVVPLFERLSLRERADAARQFSDGTSQVERDPLAAIVLLGQPEIVGHALLVYRGRFQERYPRLWEEYAPLIPLFERMSFLRTVPLFEEMPGQELRRVAEMLSDVDVAEGEVIFRKGDPGDELFIVRRGCVALRDGATELGTAKAQEFFGELALLDNEARSADAVATEATQMLRLRSADFRELMARRPQIQERVLRAVVKRLRLATGRITRVP